METVEASKADLAILFIHWQAPRKIYNPALNVFIFGIELSFIGTSINILICL